MSLPYQTTRIQAITRDYIAPRVKDQIFGAGTVAWKSVAARAEARPETTPRYPLRVGDISINTRARLGNLTGTTTATGAPATQAAISKSYQWWNIVVHEDDVNENGGSSAIANYMLTQSEIAADSARQDMEALIWTPQTSTYPHSLVDGIDGDGPGSGGTYMGVAEADCAQWSSFTMEAAHTTGTDVGVSGSLFNAQKMIHAMQNSNGKKPDAGFARGALWDHYASLVADNTYIAGSRAGYQVDWGTDTIYIAGVPIYRDDNVPGEAFDGTEATRAAQAGYRLYLVTWDDWSMPVTPGKFLQMGRWMDIPDNRVISSNLIEFQGNLICTKRRTQGVIFNIDLTITGTNVTAGTVYHAGAIVG